MIEKASAQLPHSEAWCKSEAVIFLLPGEMCCFAAQVNNLPAWIFRYISSEGKNSKGWTCTFFFNMHLRLCRFFHCEYSSEVFLVTKPKWVKEKLDSQSQKKKHCYILLPIIISSLRYPPSTFSHWPLPAPDGITPWTSSLLLQNQSLALLCPALSCFCKPLPQLHPSDDIFLSCVNCPHLFASPWAAVSGAEGKPSCAEVWSD